VNELSPMEGLEQLTEVVLRMMGEKKARKIYEKVFGQPKVSIVEPEPESGPERPSC
jgi:hypothetical protein